MNKVQIKSELKVMWNGIKEIGGIRIARVCWHEKQWKVLKPSTSWSEVSSDRGWPTEFYYQEQLINYIYENQSDNLSR